MFLTALLSLLVLESELVDLVALALEAGVPKSEEFDDLLEAGVTVDVFL